MGIKGKTPSRMMKKLLTSANLDPNQYLYVRMGPNQQGLIFVDKDTGDKILVTNSAASGGRITVELLKGGDQSCRE